MRVGRLVWVVWVRWGGKKWRKIEKKCKILQKIAKKRKKERRILTAETAGTAEKCSHEGTKTRRKSNRGGRRERGGIGHEVTKAQREIRHRLARILDKK